MADEELRELERRWVATGSRSDGERMQQALRRTRAPVIVTGQALYRCEEEEQQTVRWLRFFDDGLVLSVTTSAPAEPAEVARWFEPSHEHSSQGRWVLRGERVAFEAECVYGVVDFEGVVTGDELHLRAHSRINGHRSEPVYSLVLLPS